MDKTKGNKVKCIWLPEVVDKTKVTVDRSICPISPNS